MITMKELILKKLQERIKARQEEAANNFIDNRLKTQLDAVKNNPKRALLESRLYEKLFNDLKERPEEP